MKREKLVTAFFAAVLAFLISFGGMGSMATAFFLEAGELRMVAAACAVSAVFCAACFSWKRGGVLVLLGAALAGGYLWRLGTFPRQFWQLVYRITHVYNQAYHWGVFRLVDTAWDAGSVELPLAVLGTVLAMAAAWAVCRREGTAVVVGLSLLALLPCIVVTDTVPEPRFLYLLLLGQLLMMLTSGVRRNDAYQGNRLTMLAALPTALLLGVLFLAVTPESYRNPTEDLRERLSQWLQELPNRGLSAVETEVSVGTPGKTVEQVNLNTLGRRIDSSEPVFYVATETGGTLYLRGQDYDLYDGRAWQASPTRVEGFSYPGPSLGYVAVETRGEQDLWYLPYYPRDGMSLIGGRFGNTQLAQRYSFIRQGLPDNWQELAAAGEAGMPGLPFAAEEELRYLSLPEQTRAGARALLEPILEERNGTVEKAQAIAAFVRDSAVYDKNPNRMPEDAQDFALWFLKERERGYCVHFATAATVLLRAAGIEARYVSGYLLNTRAEVLETVTGEHAHAWAEYYVPGLNTWVVLEATPSDGLPSPVETQPQETQTATAPQETVPPAVPETTVETHTQPPTETVTPTEAGGQESQKTAPQWIGTAFRGILTMAVLAVLMEGQRRLRLGLGRRLFRRGSPNRQALRRWREAERFAARLAETPPGELKALALKAKFSQHTLEPEELRQFDGYLREAEGRLRKKAWYKQLVYRYVFALY